MIAKQYDENDYWEFGSFPEVNYCKKCCYSVLGEATARAESVKNCIT